MWQSVPALAPLAVLLPLSALIAALALRSRMRNRERTRSRIVRDAVFSELADGAVVVDADETILDVNDRARSLFPDVAVGEPATDAFAATPAVVDVVRDRDDAESVRVTVDDEDGEGTRFIDVSALHVDGAESAAGASETPETDGTVLSFRDVTERETLQRRHRALIEKSPNVIAVAGTDGRLRYVSPSIDRLLGYDPAAVDGEPFLDLVHPDDRDDTQRALEAALDAGEQRRIEHRLARSDGTWRRFETVVDRLFDGVDEVVFTATDVTEQHWYEQRLQVLNRVLRHDLKNDVNVISGYADLLRDHVDEEGAEYLDVIDGKVRSLTHLSDQAREIDVALHRDEQQYAVDLATLVPSLVDSLQRTYPQATVDVTVPDRAVVSADELIESAIRNVMENAVLHHDGDDPHVDVVVEADGDRYRVVVSDDGPGIPDAERDVFSRRRETPLEHASGLGLWLVHWVVTSSGGELEITENEPRGTVVAIALPPS